MKKCIQCNHYNHDCSMENNKTGWCNKYHFQTYHNGNCGETWKKGEHKKGITKTKKLDY